MQQHSSYQSTQHQQSGEPALDTSASSIELSAVLRELLLLEESALDAVRELKSYAALTPPIQEIGIVIAALLKHPELVVREHAFNTLYQRYDESPSIHGLLFIAAALETETTLSVSMHQQLTTKDNSRHSQLAALHGELRFNTRYAKEQNMKVFSREETVPAHTFDRIILAILDTDSTVRNKSAEALQQALPVLNEQQKEAALWHISFGLKEHATDQTRSSFQGRILSAASFFREQQHLFLPLVLKLCESSDLLLRVDAACTILFLSHDKEDLVTDIVANSLKNRFHLQAAPPLKLEDTKDQLTSHSKIADATVEFEYQWHRFGIAEFLRHHYGIDIDLYESMQQVHIEFDTIRARFNDTLNTIVAEFEKSLATQEKQTNDLFAKYFRTSLVGMAGSPLPLLSETNQQKILTQLYAIIVDPTEAAMVKCRALQLIPRATISQDESVGPLLQAALLRGHIAHPELRIQAYQTLAELPNLSAKARKIATLGITELGIYDENPAVAAQASETLRVIQERGATVNGEVSFFEL